MSQNERMSMQPPKITADGKYVCTVDNAVFGSEEDYDLHCMAADTRAGGGKA